MPNRATLFVPIGLAFAFAMNAMISYAARPGNCCGPEATSHGLKSSNPSSTGIPSEGGADGSLLVISRPSSGCPAIPYVFALVRKEPELPD